MAALVRIVSFAVDRAIDQDRLIFSVRLGADGIGARGGDAVLGCRNVDELRDVAVRHSGAYAAADFGPAD